MGFFPLSRISLQDSLSSGASGGFFGILPADGLLQDFLGGFPKLPKWFHDSFRILFTFQGFRQDSLFYRILLGFSGFLAGFLKFRILLNISTGFYEVLRDSFRDFLTISGFFLRLRDFCGIFTGFLRDS